MVVNSNCNSRRLFSSFITRRKSEPQVLKLNARQSVHNHYPVSNKSIRAFSLSDGYYRTATSSTATSITTTTTPTTSSTTTITTTTTTSF
ncbi:hypothetical protein FHG87_010658 [Trinorchestia longiramus]|nr:hypothetical protein FHG87_010658 [Trinorchestia longiramus]